MDNRLRRFRDVAVGQRFIFGPDFDSSCRGRIIKIVLLADNNKKIKFCYDDGKAPPDGIEDFFVARSKNDIFPVGLLEG